MKSLIHKEKYLLANPILIESEVNKMPGRVLKLIRALRGLEQKDVAEKTGVHTATISKIENERTSADVKTLEKLSAKLDKKLDTKKKRAQASPGPLNIYKEDC